MLDFSPVRNKELTWMEFAEEIGKEDLARLTNEMVDLQLELISDCVDAGVVFVPDDPNAHDTYAENEEDVDLAWNLGHVIVHAIASSEESAFLAAEMARGVEPHGRSRYEVPWQEVSTIEQCRHYIEQSRRMILATLDVWPDEPHLDNTYEQRPGLTMNPVVRFLHGLSHAESHIDQIREIVRQAQVARSQMK
ncbi:MAG: DinB family protein [Chloroflexi bacterium]|nr:MAG: DinB family protein [Chloroflexota bacterium]MBL1195270.1 DinB family protein [Chloroflexota bacterium]NOH12554.1 DinB family protein [Chloroflexota bacterium]